jgi:hypothetical protein
MDICGDVRRGVGQYRLDAIVSSISTVFAQVLKGIPTHGEHTHLNR